VELEDEKAWLRARIIRLRRLLRYVKDTQVEAGLKEFIGDAEARLDMLERNHPRDSPQRKRTPSQCHDGATS
jgi:hypothetical protein